MTNQITRTIVALVTAPIDQNIAIIRISGPASYEIVRAICSKEIAKLALKRTTVVLDRITKNGVTIDQVLLFLFRKPNSFTGEDTIEISCHGNLAIVNKILELLLAQGAILATPGEFSKQAFFNGKLNLIQANAINDLIRAPNLVTAKMAVENFDSKKQKELARLEDELLDVIAKVEINIDYPEYEDVERITPTKLREVASRVLREIVVIRKKGKRVQIYEQGIKIGIFGKPNVGKSTLLNALLDEDKAIVSPIPGTTRDVVEGRYALDGIPLILFDTAGIRTTTDQLEESGIQKSKQMIAKLDLCLFLVDNSRSWSTEDKEIFNLVSSKNYLLVLNKCDLIANLHLPAFIQREKVVEISAEHKKLVKLETRIKELFLTSSNHQDNQYPFLAHSWQQSRLKIIEEKLNKLVVAIDNKIPVDVIAGDLQVAFRLLRELSGNEYDEDLLEMMFSKFCIGK